MSLRKSVAHADMRKMNMVHILDQLRQFAPLSRSQLAVRTGLNKATVTSIIRELIEKNYIKEIGIKPDVTDVGHPSIDLEVNEDAGWIIGVEMRRQSASVILSGLSEKIFWRQGLDYDTRVDGDTILDSILELMHKAHDFAKDNNKQVLGIGFCVPGLVNIHTGMLMFDPIFGWNRKPLGDIVQQHFDLPVYIGNEAIMAALGESFYGNAHDYEHVLYISSGASMGGGIIFNGDILPGSSGLGGGVGHMLVCSDGKTCSCGNVGCWETVANQDALFQYVLDAVSSGEDSLLAQVTADTLSVDEVIQAAQQQDKVALAAFNEVAYWLGVGFVNLINVLNPNLVVFGGVLSKASDYILPVLQQTISQKKSPWLDDVEIRVATFRDDASLIGAAATVFYEGLNHPERLLL